MMVARNASSVSSYEQQETVMLKQSASQSDRVRQAEVLLPHTWDGAVVTSTRHNPVVEAELPFYSNIRFFPAKQANQTGSGIPFTSYHWMSTIWEASSTASALIHCFVSVGEDYTLGFFTGAPVAWRVPQASEPAAS